MKRKIDNLKFDTQLIPSDWRYSAAIVGLYVYFIHNDIGFEIDSKTGSLFYNQKDICGTVAKERFVNTIKDIYKIDDEFTESRAKNGIYNSFCRVSRFFLEAGNVCRLNGYYVQSSKKGKSIAWNSNLQQIDATDCEEFDFILFAFTPTRSPIFINCNADINILISENIKLHEQIKDYNADPRRIIFDSSSDSFISSSVEVIAADKKNKMFKTMFVREQAIDIFKSISKKQYDILCHNQKINDKYIDVFDIVCDRILNYRVLDDVIEKFIKHIPEQKTLIFILIEINEQIYKLLKK